MTLTLVQGVDSVLVDLDVSTARGFIGRQRLFLDIYAPIIIFGHIQACVDL